MAKVTGIPTSIALDNAAGAAKTITNDVTSISIATPTGMQEVTGMDKLAVERLSLLHDASGSMKGVFNVAADMSHAVLSTVSAGVQVTRTLAIGYPGATLTLEVWITDYQIERGEDGKLTWTAPFVLANGTAAAWT
jgi:hypothetical protein